MKMLWQTPIAHISIDRIFQDLDLPKFNAKLSYSILHEYKSLFEKNSNILTKNGGELNDANQVFFEWQARGGWNNFLAFKEFRILEDFLQIAVDKYLTGIGLSDVNFFCYLYFNINF